MRRGFAPIVIVAIIAAFLIGIGATVAYLKLQSQPTLVTKITYPSEKPQSATATPTPNEFADWKTYENKKYGYSFKYPQQLTVRESEVEGRTNVSIEESGKAILRLEAFWFGRGCGGEITPSEAPNWGRKALLRVGNKSLEVTNFCGSDEYIFYGTSSSGQTIQLDALFIGQSNEKIGKELLKSISGIDNIRTQE